MHGELAQQVRLNAALAKLAKSLISLQDIEDIGKLVVELAKELTDSATGSITYINPKTSCTLCPDPTTIQEGRCLSVPMIINGTPQLSITLSNAPRDYTLYDIEIVQQLIDLYSIAVQKKQIEIEKQESLNYFELILNSIPDGFILCEVTDSHLKVLKANSRALNFVGLTEQDVTGKFFHEILPTEMAEAWTRNSLNIIAGKKLKTYEATNKFGTFEINSVPVFNNSGSRNHLIVIAREISEKRKTEEHFQKMEKLESVGLLAGGIAHDFNNILTAIIGNASLAKLKLGKDNDSKIFQLLTEIEDASIGAKDLTQQLLTFAEGGTPVLETVSVGQLLKDSSASALRGSNVRCKFDLPDNLWPVEIDRGQINQVINNLVINADQAMKGGGILNITAQNTVITNDCLLPLQEGKYVQISVQDHGEGIPPEYLDKLFDPYFTTKQMGSGLGLTTSYSIIIKHNGFITVESDPGIGTTFNVYLPASKAEPSSNLTEKNSMDHQGKILVMDDEKMLRFVLNEMLTHLGYEVACARDGSEAISMYVDAAQSDDPFDGVIMDLTIPGGMGGKEAIQRLIEINPKVKAIVSSGYSNDPVMSNHEEYGFSAVVTKPFTIEQLAATLQNLLVDDEICTTAEIN